MENRAGLMGIGFVWISVHWLQVPLASNLYGPEGRNNAAAMGYQGLEFERIRSPRKALGRTGPDWCDSRGAVRDLDVDERR